MSQDQRKAETHERLLDAAAHCFARDGFHAVSTDAVAEAAGRTSGALYAHFGSKEGLLLALLARWENETISAVATALDSEDSVDGRGDVLWRTLTGDPDGLLLEHELWLYAARHPEVSERLARRYATARRKTADSLREWADGDTDPETTATLLMALLLGLEMQRRLDPDAVDDEVALRGLRLLMGD